MTIRVSAAEWNDLTTRLAAAEKKLAAAERAEKSRLARNLKERCRHLLVGKTGSLRREWYDSATQSQRDARVEEILIEVGVKEAPKEEEEEEEEEECDCGKCSRCVADDTCAAQCGDKGTITVVGKDGTTSLVCKDCCAWFKKQNK